jgi:hypothetical protein
MKRMLIIVSLLILISCSKGEKVSTGFKDLPQPLQKIINDGSQNCPDCGITVNLVKWKAKNLYGAVCNGPACNCAYLYFDNLGNTISFDIEVYNEISSQAVFVSRIWSCSN